MAMMPFSVEWSKDQFPHKISGHVAVTWTDSVIVWGGYNGSGSVPRNVVFQSAAGGEWVSRDASGDVPEDYNYKAHVVNDKMFLLKTANMARNVIHALDLNTLAWEALAPRNTLSESELSELSELYHHSFTSWVHMGRIYFFGGGCSNYCYNTMNNSWEWPLHRGEVPSPRKDPATIIVDDTVYLFGGNSMSAPDLYHNDLNDLAILDMRSMMWRKVHGNCYQEEAPHSKLDPDHTFTIISSSAAVLYGVKKLDGEQYSPECWLLNLDKAKQLKDPTSIWTRIPTPFPRVVHASVLEPVSQRLWVIGGWASDQKDFTSDVIKMSGFNTLPLKTIAMDHIARNMKATDPRLSANNYPKRLISEIFAEK